MRSVFPSTLTLFSSFLVVKGAPNVSPGKQLFPRANPCERGGTPVLYQDYGPDVCPGKYQLNPDGKTCPMNLEDNCEVFCQTSFDVTEQHCGTRPSYTPDSSSIKGATIFVKIDCSNNKRLPMDQQNPAYRHDGVAGKS
ncbi:MAG: hypothetical protein Q9182_000293, partial [Xanthomendoza sp. 2 TL-2023]